ncbi:MAG: class I SAM-dependent DNA methyltransferase, partial [Micrococcales bacterium]|nr:class I SAM-dependent DNA methyltransferase [Micrococcales bacterium]
AWRAMAALTNERTLICALICPGTGHIHGVASGGAVDMRHLAQIAGFASSLLADFLIRATPKSAITSTAINGLPMVLDSPLLPDLRLRTLRLNCLTEAYDNLWFKVWQSQFAKDTWAGGRERSNRLPLGVSSRRWARRTPLRLAEDRRQALVEIDALVAVMLDVTADELCTVYRTQFPVLFGYDQRRDFYDCNGRLVPQEVLKVWRAKGCPDGLEATASDNLSIEERTATNQAGHTYTYQLPFVTLDREADMRGAHAHFSRLLQERP